MEKNTEIHLRISEADKEKIRTNMEAAGVKNMSAYIMKMAIDGYIIVLDLSDVKEVVRLMRINSNNLNQYAKKANEIGSIYIHDINQLKDQQEGIWELIRQILERLSNIK
ncbi:MAG: plasmid mobilization relaxosome protein MobC [Butyrivibrio sp.]|nr:plasmid mobilization relaxosome protein MobC [Butyrivibrio sp.]